ncbi:MAG: riboflavin biosynthesis protein RibF [Clostridia bacterium]|nr:riboflavin biosynthesis protein RibF [Clostridia bacterium]
MKIIDLKTGDTTSLSPDARVCCALGNFDGVHLGHRALLTAAAEKHGCTASAVWTFSTPSSRAVSGASLLTDPDERLERFRACGIELAILFDFEELKGMDAEHFVRDVLYRDCHVRHAVCGFNFRYGNRAAGNAATLRDTLAALGGKTTVIPPYEMDGTPVSSSVIREALAEGDMETVTAMLTRPYAISSEVLHGKQLGRTLGFPTANQRFPIGRAVPRFGVYAVRVTVDGKAYHGVANVGVRPTVEHTDAANCESFVFAFNGTLYGKRIQTEFLHFIRKERRFSDVTELKDAVCRDILDARAYFLRSEDRA